MTERLSYGIYSVAKLLRGRVHEECGYSFAFVPDGTAATDDEARTRLLREASAWVEGTYGEIAVLFDTRQPNAIGYVVRQSEATIHTGVDYFALMRLVSAHRRKLRAAVR